MFTSVLEKILASLAGISSFKTTDVWQGEVKELLDKVQKFPSAHILLSGADFDEPKTIRGELAPSETVWSIIVLSESLRDRATGAVESLKLIEALLEYADPADPATIPGLTRLNTGYGRLWPSAVQFLGTEGGKSAYGVKFYNKKGH